jgi:hypothetical protein
MTTTLEATATPVKVKTVRPTIAERARDRICPECNGPVERRSPKGPMPVFCCHEHKKAFGNRQLVEGRAVIGLLKAWRIDRAQGEIAQQSFAQVCQIVDQFNFQDRDAKRPRADLYAAKVLNEGTLFIDRQRRR